MDWWPVALAAVCAGSLVPLAIRARSIGHDDPGGVRKLHRVPISRLGGAIVAIAYLAVLAVALAVDHAALRSAVPLVLSAMPVALVGLAEDLTRRVRPRYRMAAAVVSAALASVFAGGVIPRVDLPFVDILLDRPWFALPLTWFMVAGACNAINLVDGANGLAGGTALLMFGGIAAMAGGYGDMQTLAEALVMMGALVGFLFWNYPRGRIFLGDAGAYFLGFMYAELSIRLVARNQGVSAWYVILLAAYPIVETLFSMYRRGFIRRRALMAPDALHLHSLLFRRVAVPLERRLGRVNLDRANARIAPRLWLHTVVCLAVAIAFHGSTPVLLLGLFGYAAWYMYRYRALVRFKTWPAIRKGVAPPGSEHGPQAPLG